MDSHVTVFLLFLCCVPPSFAGQTGQTTNCSKDLGYIFTNLTDYNKQLQVQLSSSETNNCPSITFLNSNFTCLSGFIEKFPKLEKITANKSGIKTLSFIKSVELTVLILDHNQVSSLNDSTFENVTSLQTIDLSHNKVSLIQDETFKGLKKLTILKLSHNKLTAFSLDWLRSDTFFQDLELQNNKIMEITSTADCQIKQVRKVLLGNNNLTNISGINCFGKINQLRLPNNPQLILKATHFKSFASNLTKLFINGVCKLEQLNDILSSMPNLTILAIGNINFETNKIFTKLTHLHIRGDKMQSIDYKNFKTAFPSLTRVDLLSNFWNCKYRTAFVLHLKSQGINIFYENTKINGTNDEVISKLGCTTLELLPILVWTVIIIFSILLLLGFVITCKYRLAVSARKKEYRASGGVDNNPIYTSSETYPPKMPHHDGTMSNVDKLPTVELNPVYESTDVQQHNLAVPQDAVYCEVFNNHNPTQGVYCEGDFAMYSEPINDRVSDLYCTIDELF